MVILAAAKQPEDLLLCHVRAYRRSQKQILPLASLAAG